ncbi:MAG: hypothetical protein F6J93_01465 [Oscillatoria sp. SIO1A7]|nr:hypothetical protein [Oscillatoria sp. SIO1A7]
MAIDPGRSACARIGSRQLNRKRQKTASTPQGFLYLPRKALAPRMLVLFGKEFIVKIRAVSP